MSIMDTAADWARQLSPIWIAFLVIMATRGLSRFVVRAWAWYRDRAWLGAWRSFGAVFRLTRVELWFIALFTSAIIGALGVWLAELATPPPICAPARSCAAAPRPYAAVFVAPLNGFVSGAGALVPHMPDRLAPMWQAARELWPLVLALGWALCVILPAWLGDRRRVMWLATGRGLPPPRRS